MTRVWLVTLFGAAAGLSCSDTIIPPIPQLNLNRPVDIAFTCYGNLNVDGKVSQTAQSTAWCDQQSPQNHQLAVNARSTEQLPALPPPPPGQDTTEVTPSWYGFILQSASGTVAITRFPAKPANELLSGVSTLNGEIQVLDADPRTPGKNSLSIGEAPIAIVTDTTGCYEVTANAGSCDLSELDINSALTADSTTTVKVTRAPVVTAMGPIRARPAAMVVQPNPDEFLAKSCPAAPQGQAYIAYPGCHLVAGVDLATGEVKSAIQFVGKVPHVLSAAELMTLTCENECNAAAASTPPGAPDEIRPVTLALRGIAPAATRRPGEVPRLAIGADNAASITVVDLGMDFVPPMPPVPPVTVALEDTLKGTATKLGVSAVALSPQIAMGNTTNPANARRNSNLTTFINPEGPPPGGEGQYVYAVTTDGTVRVVDVLKRKECDTQVDMRFVRNPVPPKTRPTIPQLQCLAVGDPATPPRRAGAKGPGIELPVDGVPTSVTFFKGLDVPLTAAALQFNADGTPVLVDADGNVVLTGGTQLSLMVDSPPSPGMLIGYFAVISASSGQVYVVNVDDDDSPDQFDPANPLATAPVLVMPHQLRDSFGDRSAPAALAVTTAMPSPGPQCTAIDPLNATTGGPRSSSKPGSAIPATTLPASKLADLPTLLQERCVGTDPGTHELQPPVAVSELQLSASLALRDAVYPDLRSARNETWTLSWEGTLSNDNLFSAVDGPQIRNGQMIVDSHGMRLVDQSRPFCEMGVEPFDIVQFRGCNPANQDGDCPSGYTCFVSDKNQVANLGACMLKAEAPRLAVACNDFLTTARRYTVSRADSGELTLLPRKHVLSTTPVDGCTSDLQCKTLASYATTLRSANQPNMPSDPVPPPTWKCELDPQRAPVNNNPLAARCVETCSKTSDCEVGTICVGATGGPDPDGRCMESVLPPQSCVNGPQRFEVHASEAFTLVGLRTGYVHPFVERAAIEANPDPNKTHECVRNPAASPLQVGRIPLVAPACGDPLTTDPITGALAGGRGFEPNPCSLSVTQTEELPNYISSACALPGPDDPDKRPPTKLVDRVAPAIKLRTETMTLTMVDPYSPGDLNCVLDRQGTLGRIPMVLQAPFNVAFAPGYQLTFDQKAGFTPLPAGAGSVAPAFPVRLVHGPSESIWVMDDGDSLATQIGQSSTRGQVFRIESSNLGKVNILQ